MDPKNPDSTVPNQTTDPTTAGKPATPPKNGDSPQSPDQARLKLKEKLREKKKEFDTAQAEITKRKNQADKLKSDMATLEKSYQEIDKTLQEFEQSLDDIKCERDKFQKYIDKARADFEPLPTKEDVKRIREVKDDEIKTTQNEEVEDLEVKSSVTPSDCLTVQCSENKLANETLELEGKQKAYDEAKQAVTSLQTSLKELADLSKLMEKENEQGNTKLAYVYFLDMEKKLEDVKERITGYDVNPPSGTLYTAWKELLEAQTEVRNAQDELTQRTQNLDAAKQKLAELKKDRISNIFDAIKAELA